MTMENAALDADVARETGEIGSDSRTTLLPDASDAITAGRDLLGLQAVEADRVAAFTAPLVQRLQANPSPRVERATRVLVVMPTREIAGRVEIHLREILEPLGFKVLLVQGGADYAAQAAALAEGIDVLVATTGRLLDHLAKGTALLERVELMIVDGADRMRDIRFLRDVHRIVEGLPEKRQIALLSAVASDDVREFAAAILRDPVHVEVRSADAGTEVRVERGPRQGPRRQRQGSSQPRGNSARDNNSNQDRDQQPRDNQAQEPERRYRDQDRQPISHESSLFPSSGPVFGYGDNRGGNRRPRGGGSGRRGGNY